MATNYRIIKKQEFTDVTSVDITNIFNENYDVYKVCMVGGGLAGYGYLRFLDSSSNPITTANYQHGFLQMKMNSAWTQTFNTYNYLPFVFAESPTGNNPNGYNEAVFYSPYDNTRWTVVEASSRSFVSTTAFRGGTSVGALRTTDRITGIQMYSNLSNYFSGQIIVYGVRL